MSKCLLIIDIDDEMLRKYDHFILDYNLQGRIKGENLYRSLEYIEKYPLVLLNDDIKDIWRVYYE